MFNNTHMLVAGRVQSPSTVISKQPDDYTPSDSVVNSSIVFLFDVVVGSAVGEVLEVSNDCRVIGP